LDPFPFASAIKCHQKSTYNSAPAWVVRWILSTPPSHPAAGRCGRVVPVLPLRLLRLHPPQHAAAQPPSPAPSAACSSAVTFACTLRSMQQRSRLRRRSPQHAAAQPPSPALSAACSSATSFACTRRSTPHCSNHNTVVPLSSLALHTAQYSALLLPQHRRAARIPRAAHTPQYSALSLPLHRRAARIPTAAPPPTPTQSLLLPASPPDSKIIAATPRSTRRLQHPRCYSPQHPPTPT
jgi:hypothetical protein